MHENLRPTAEIVPQLNDRIRGIVEAHGQGHEMKRDSGVSWRFGTDAGVAKFEVVGRRGVLWGISIEGTTLKFFGDRLDDKYDNTAGLTLEAKENQIVGTVLRGVEREIRAEEREAAARAARAARKAARLEMKELQPVVPTVFRDPNLSNKWQPADSAAEAHSSMATILDSYQAPSIVKRVPVGDHTLVVTLQREGDALVAVHYYAGKREDLGGSEKFTVTKDGVHRVDDMGIGRVESDGAAALLELNVLLAGWNQGSIVDMAREVALWQAEQRDAEREARDWFRLTRRGNK